MELNKMNYYIKTLILFIFLAPPCYSQLNFQCSNSAIEVTNLAEQMRLIDQWNDAYWQTLKEDAEVTDLRAKHHDSFYRQCLNKQLNNIKIEALSTDDIKQLAFITSDNSFYVNDFSTTLAFKKVIEEMVKRELDVTNYLNDLVSRYVKHRKFDLANRIIAQYNLADQDLLPVIKNSTQGNRTLLTIDSTHKIFNQHDFYFRKGAQIVVVSSPMCNPSKRFLTWLNNNAKLRKVFEQHSTWINPASSYLHLDMIESRNAINTNIPLHYVNKEIDWPEIKYWGTPTFYFYQDGLRVKQLVGWPKEGREDELISILENLSLI